MGEMVELHAKDEHTLGAYTVQTGKTAKAGLVIVQEIFGVNGHIRDIADRYAEDGFVTIAPALFDRIERGVDLSYEGEDAQKARALQPKFEMEKAVADVAAAVEWLHGLHLKVGVVGYCLGGTLAWLSAARLPIDAAVGYYGGQISKFLGDAPKAPIMLHFGDQDQHIPATEIEAISSKYPDVPIFHYPAGHGFNCDRRASFDAPSSKLARDRTLAFLREHLS